MSEEKHYFFKDHPQTCDREDFWGQVKRTVNGKPVPQEQIDLIVKQVIDLLEIEKTDILLDLCCGNGALTTYFFSQCQGGLGVDFSEYLIDIAKKHFSKRPSEEYRLKDVLHYVRVEPNPERFTKAVCYGSFQYLAKDSAAEMLSVVRKRFSGLSRFCIGNVPDKDRLHDFIDDDKYSPGMEDLPSTPIGVWRSKKEFSELASENGWDSFFRQMPDKYFSAHYRYDVLLVPA
ncbi:MAG: methyltransferase domain-containing protein [Planctomycetes bacterium]|nr:methyltransferase domain-containing protein [Planctomycetota bacterium]